MPRSSLVIHLKAAHAQLNRKSDIFGLLIGSFQGCSFHDRWSRGTKTLGTRLPALHDRRDGSELANNSAANWPTNRIQWPTDWHHQSTNSFYLTLTMPFAKVVIVRTIQDKWTKSDKQKINKSWKVGFALATDWKSHLTQHRIISVTQHRTLHNTDRYTTQNVTQYRMLHNTERYTTKNVTQYRTLHNTMLHNTERYTVQNVTQHRTLHSTERYTTQNVTQYRALHNTERYTVKNVTQHRTLHSTERYTTQKHFFHGLNCG